MTQRSLAVLRDAAVRVPAELWKKCVRTPRKASDGPGASRMSRWPQDVKAQRVATYVTIEVEFSAARWRACSQVLMMIHQELLLHQRLHRQEEAGQSVLSLGEPRCFERGALNSVDALR
ncbi:unnamed protein product [Arctogadus glacialis]